MLWEGIGHTHTPHTHTYPCIETLVVQYIALKLSTTRCICTKNEQKQSQRRQSERKANSFAECSVNDSEGFVRNSREITTITNLPHPHGTPHYLFLEKEDSE